MGMVLPGGVAGSAAAVCGNLAPGRTGAGRGGPGSLIRHAGVESSLRAGSYALKVPQGRHG